MAVTLQFILCSLTILCSFNNYYSPLPASVQLNVKPENTFSFKQFKSRLCGKKMSVEHTEFKLQTTEINFEKLLC